MPTKWHKKGGTAMLILERVDFKTKYFVKTGDKETFTNQKRTNSFGRHNHRCIHLFTKLKIHEAKILQNKWKIMGVWNTTFSVISKQVDKN